MLSLSEAKTLKKALYATGPAFYKDDFHFSSACIPVVAVLRASGYAVECNEDNGKITVEKAGVPV